MTHGKFKAKLDSKAEQMTCAQLFSYAKVLALLMNHGAANEDLESTIQVGLYGCNNTLNVN